MPTIEDLQRLVPLGWDEDWTRVLETAGMEIGWIPARVGKEERELYHLHGIHGELTAQVSGSFRDDAVTPNAFPKVGDWVMIAPRPNEGKATIHAILPRRSVLSRKEPWVQTLEQILAVNVDVVIVVCGLDGDFNIRRIERYLAMASGCGIRPVVVLNKADLGEDPESAARQVAAIAAGIPVLLLSAMDGRGLDDLRNHLPAGRTVCFLGSSGVGKSSLINRLLGEDRQPVNEVRTDDSKGRHTTTRRELIVLPGGSIVVDSPGIREVQLWAEDASIGTVFADVEALVERCRFRNCAHGNEPGCAIQAGLRSGALEQDRYGSYLKLLRESRRLAIMKTVKSKRMERALTRKLRMRGPDTILDRDPAGEED